MKSDSTLMKKSKSNNLINVKEPIVSRFENFVSLSPHWLGGDKAPDPSPANIEINSRE